jgi:hypothetical protein
VPTVLGFVEGHHHEMGQADGDVLQAARAQIGLACLERVDERDLEVLFVVLGRQPKNAQMSSRAQTTNAAMTIA